MLVKSSPFRSALLALSFCFLASCAHDAKQRGVMLSELTWQEAEPALGPNTVVVIPLGAAAKEHGPHLRLDNDLRATQYYTTRVLEAADVVVAPLIPYHYYPAFLEYPGSTHLSFNTARDLVVDIVRSLANYGPHRFYVLNYGVSTVGPLNASAEILAAEGILLRYTDIISVSGEVVNRIEEQKRGTHADELETSEMLYMNPDRVDMRLAVRDDNPRHGPGPLTRKKGGAGVYSPTGVWGDPTLATREKGKIVVEETIKGILNDIEALRSADLPVRR
jgi:creatinine amidohydrolase